MLLIKCNVELWRRYKPERRYELEKFGQSCIYFLKRLVVVNPQVLSIILVFIYLCYLSLTCMCKDSCVEVRVQLVGVSPILVPHGSQAPNSGHKS